MKHHVTISKKLSGNDENKESELTPELLQVFILGSLTLQAPILSYYHLWHSWLLSALSCIAGIVWGGYYFSPVAAYGRKLREFAEALTDEEYHSKGTIRISISYLLEKEKISLEISTKGIVKDKQALAVQLSDFLSLRLMSSSEKAGLLKAVFAREDEEKIIYRALSDFKPSPKLLIPLSSDYVWNLNKQPMGLIVGGTGSGKTKLIEYLILSFLKNRKKNVVFVIDGKSAYLSQVMREFYDSERVASDPDDVITLLTDLTTTMNERYQKMAKKVEDKTYLELYKRAGAILLVVDELLSLITELDASKESKPKATQIKGLLLSLINKGRQANLHVLVSGQKLSSQILPTDARDSLGLRIVLGRVSQTQAQEIFDLGLSQLPQSDSENHGGLVYLDGLGWQLPRAFLPIFADLDFAEAIQEIKGNE